LFFNKLHFCFLEQQMKSSSINKQKSLPQNKRTLSKPSEKSASEHMTLAQEKLNHYQKNQQSKSPLPKTSNSNNNTKTLLSPIKSKSKENNKNPSRTSKVYEIDMKVLIQTILLSSSQLIHSFKNQNQHLKPQF
jgi:hypothetical protein